MPEATKNEEAPVASGSVPEWFDDLWSDDRRAQNAAFSAAMTATRESVGWGHEVWDEVVDNLSSPDNHNRAIASQVLCNLAAHDDSDRILDDLDELIDVTRDDRFVTARHCLQSLWKIGLAGPTTRKAIVDRLEDRYADCADEKNSTLIRSDIVLSLRHLYDATDDAEIVSRAREMIETEPDSKYRAKYGSHWKGVD